MKDSSEKIAHLYYTKNTGLAKYVPIFERENLQAILLAAELRVGDLPEDDLPKLFLIDPEFLANSGMDFGQSLKKRVRSDIGILLVAASDRMEQSSLADEEWVYDYLVQPFSSRQMFKTVRNALNHIRMQLEMLQINRQLTRRHKEIGELIHIGNQLSAERDHVTLLNMILQKSREITTADSATLYLVQNNDTLLFKLSQNETLKSNNYIEFTMPMTEKSIAGYVALTKKAVNLKDSYHLPPESKFRQNRSFDEQHGYRTKSMLAVPMEDHTGRVIGVIQLINKKPVRGMELVPISIVEDVVISFDDNDERLVSSLASQAAVSIENNRLYKSIQSLFEGFVEASVSAVESRDPATSGHSQRVAILTVGLAEIVDRCDDGRFRDVKFTRDQVKEIRYASLLHDFGKVGVREKVLVKAKKLYEHDMVLIRNRFDFARRTVQWQHEKRKLQFLLTAGREAFLSHLSKFDLDLEREIAKLDDYLKFVSGANEPTVLDDGSFERLLEIAHETYEDIYGRPQTLLDSNEVRFLSIRRGTLDEEERSEISSHVTHTFKFLSKIPWTGEIRDVPRIAYGHHEKLDGSGYPNNLMARDIPLQTRMMTISDIYDALSASDRPYKPAVPADRALQILNYEVNEGKLDADLLKLFIDGKVYEKTRDFK